MMRDYLADGWQQVLAHNGLSAFDALWDLQVEWFEPPNEGRGGWSGVARLDLELPNGGSEGVFLKRQENHLRRTLRHPFSGEPTFAGEMQNIQLLQRAGVPTLDPVYYGQRLAKGRWRAILITRELQGYHPLDWWIDHWLEAGWAINRTIRQAVLKESARVIKCLHDHRLVHNALYPKHLFVKVTAEAGRPAVDIRLIDLEKMRRRFTPMQAARRDLDSLNRRCGHFSLADRMRFLTLYLGTSHLSPKDRILWRYFSHRMLAFTKERSRDG